MLRFSCVVVIVSFSIFKAIFGDKSSVARWGGVNQAFSPYAASDLLGALRGSDAPLPSRLSFNLTELHAGAFSSSIMLLKLASCFYLKATKRVTPSQKPYVLQLNRLSFIKITIINRTSNIKRGTTTRIEA